MDAQHLAELRKGVEPWNAWRNKNPKRRPDLSSADIASADLTGADLSGTNLTETNLSGAYLIVADLTGADLTGANLSEAYLTEAQLSGAYLTRANLSGANLTGANLSEAHLTGADLTGADLSGTNLTSTELFFTNLSQADLSGANLLTAILSGANLSGANLTRADLFGAHLSNANLSGANLTGANLDQAKLVRTSLQKATLTDCIVYGLSAWDVNLDGAIQANLRITPKNQPAITVDDLEVAQFMYLLLNNRKIRQVIDTITSKVVLVLGRFTPERKAVLEAMREELRKCDFLPVLFDFDKPSSKDTHETITTLARMARFVIADITEAKSIPQELVSIVEQLPSLPVQPILNYGTEPWGMFDHIRRYPWVLPLHEYRGVADLLPCLKETVIALAKARVNEQRSVERSAP